MISLEQLDKIKIHFIVARPRTGSTLLSTMLNHHHMILSTIEEPFAYFLYPKYHKIKKWTSKTINDYCTDFFLFSNGKLFFQFGTKEELKQALELYVKDLTYARAIRISYLCFSPTKDKSKISTVVNKQLIMGNYLSKIAKIFPDSKFIFLYRNPLDSLPRVKNLSQKQGNPVGLYFLAVDWFYSYFLIIKKKKKILTKRVLGIHYEELIFHADTELKRICRFLNVPYEESMLKYMDDKKLDMYLDSLDDNKIEDKYFMSKKSFLSLHGDALKKPDTSKVNKWKESISINEANLIWSVCGNKAEALGYVKDNIISNKKPSLIFYFHLVRYYFTRRLITKLWYISPFFVKRFFKVIKKRVLKKAD